MMLFIYTMLTNNRPKNAPDGATLSTIAQRNHPSTSSQTTLISTCETPHSQPQTSLSSPRHIPSPTRQPYPFLNESSTPSLSLLRQTSPSSTRHIPSLTPSLNASSNPSLSLINVPDGAPLSPITQMAQSPSSPNLRSDRRNQITNISSSPLSSQPINAPGDTHISAPQITKISPSQTISTIPVHQPQLIHHYSHRFHGSNLDSSSSTP